VKYRTFRVFPGTSLVSLVFADIADQLGLPGQCARHRRRYRSTRSVVVTRIIHAVTAVVVVVAGVTGRHAQVVEVWAMTSTDALLAVVRQYRTAVVAVAVVHRL